MKRLTLLLISVAAGLVLLAAIQSSGPRPAGVIAARPEQADPSQVRALQARYRALIKQLAQLAPTEPYVVVDTARNHLSVRRRDEVLLDAVVSTGSGVVLDKPGQASGQWVFDTPRGDFTVQSKLTNPVWVKPDWAFVEEGQEIPKNAADRVESGVLGEYALGFGKGYFIHGTLYPRLLGKNVTHGCIRLNDDDLQSLYRLATVGTPIMIF